MTWVCHGGFVITHDIGVSWWLIGPMALVCHGGFLNISVCGLVLGGIGGLVDAGLWRDRASWLTDVLERSCRRVDRCP